MMAQDAQWKIQECMLQDVAAALGPDLLAQVAFVGGCTTALLVTDQAVREGARATDDVDVMIHVLGMSGWYSVQDLLRSRGFRQVKEDEVICRLRLPRDGEASLIVDFMPDDEKILGFGNRWYALALSTAIDHRLPNGAVIRVVAPPCFVATKLEAWKGRGRNDALASRDVDDLVTLIVGRPALVDELRAANPALRQFVSMELTALLRHPDFGYVLQSVAGGSPERERALLGCMRALIQSG